MQIYLNEFATKQHPLLQRGTAMVHYSVVVKFFFHICTKVKQISPLNGNIGLINESLVYLLFIMYYLLSIIIIIITPIIIITSHNLIITLRLAKPSSMPRSQSQ